MLRSVVFEDAHSGPDDAVAAGKIERIDVAVRSGGRLTDDHRDLVSLDDAHDRLGVADGAAVGEEDELSANAGRLRLDVPAAGGVVIVENVIGAGDDRHVPSRRLNRHIDQVSEKASAELRIAAQVENHASCGSEERKHGVEAGVRDA